MDGDVFAFGQQLDVSGHVTGDVISFAQTVRISGQVDGNVRAFANNMTINGTVGRNVLSFNQVLNLDTSGSIGRSLTMFGQTMTLDGKIGSDFLAFFQQASISGAIEGSMRGKGKSLTISPTAEIDGKAEFEGEKPATVSPEAKLASPLQFTKHEPHSDHDRGVGYYIWRLIWTAAFVLLGLVIYGLFPRFAVDTVEAGEHYGAAFGLGVLVTFGLPIAAIIACITIVGLLLGISTLFLYVIVFMCTDIVVGTIVGPMATGPHERLLAAGGAHGAGRTPGAPRHEYPLHRILGVSGGCSMGYGRYLAGGLPPFAACGRSQYSVCSNGAAN